MAVTSRGRVETCAVHVDRPATVRCSACHRPACAECAFSTADGKFCSHECAARTADFRAHYHKPQRGGFVLGGPGKVILWLAVILVALCVVNRYVGKVPLIGKYLWKPPAVEPY